jgi:RNA polymerase sigma factor (sigma-70 family)
VSAESQKGRVAAFIATEWNRLVASVRGWIDDAADRDAEDVVQDVLERLLENADVTDPVADLSAYFYRSLRNRIIDLYRKPKRTAELPEELADLREGFEEEIELAEMTGEMFEAIDELPPAQREVLVATELEGRSFKELAEEWKVPLGTLLARKHRAILSLRETLTGGEA